MTSFEEFTDFVGLKDYRALEEQYLPRERMEEQVPARHVEGRRA